MKKLLALAVMCCLAVTAVLFTSCENGNEKNADPATQPIAGKTYRETILDGEVYS